ncbi:MAG: hypothetical protein AAFZ80_04930 [Cyanobacteria bacterium P01_A01_bin.105]
MTISLPIAIDKSFIAGSLLWALALYLGFSPVGEWLMQQLMRGFSAVGRLIYTSQPDPKNPEGEASQAELYASIFSIIPFIGAGVLCTYLVDYSFDRSWTLSLGIIACMSCGVYELGRRQSEM